MPEPAQDASTSRKRSSDQVDEPDTQLKASKAPKLFPLFSKPDAAHSAFSWAPALGPAKTCLHGINLAPEPRSKVAAFDLDGCLIVSSHGAGKKLKAKSSDTLFEWWRPVVPKRLKQVYDDGYSIIMVTNQALRGADAIEQWKRKIPHIAEALSEVPFHILAATAKDIYRKPLPGMWLEIERMFSERGVQIDKSGSFFVGDAAGRTNDFAGTDRKWALNLDLPFHTPEEYFLDLPVAPYSLQGFHPSSLPQNITAVTPTSTPLVPQPGAAPEIVVFVGLPALGKSSFYRRHFQPAGYVHVNQDTLKTRPKCIKVVDESISAGKSCVVDNTNRDVATRKYYVDVAKKRGVPIRCIIFQGSVELAQHNNVYRACTTPPDAASKEPARGLLPKSVLAGFDKAYEEPTLAEGFAEIKKVNFVFEGSDAERARWNMWLQVDGK